jgi:hypothetical protein
MWPAPRWSSAPEWPKLDLLPHHLSRLTLTWTVPYSEEAVERFGELLIDPGGSFIGVLSYTKHRVKHHRIESAQTGMDERADLYVSVSYEAGDEILSHLPKVLEEEAALIEPLTETQFTTPTDAQATFTYPAGARFRSRVPLPLPLPDAETYADAFDQVIGYHAERRAVDGDPATRHSFTLDLDDAGGLTMVLDFALPPGPIGEAPEQALRQAVALSERIVVKER